jgi:hypothetical protein
MMDWTDAGKLARRLKKLRASGNHRSLYVAATSGGARHSRVAMAAFMAVNALLSACNYSPSSSEREAKRVAVNELRSVLERLPKPDDLEIAKDPVTGKDDAGYDGNYRGRTAHYNGRYYTSLPPEETCEIYWRFVQTRPEWVPTSPPCAVRSQPSRFIDVTSLYQKEHEVRFRLTIIAGPRERAPDARGSLIQLEMYYAVDARSSAQCIPAALTGAPLPCEEADWDGLD